MSGLFGSLAPLARLFAVLAALAFAAMFAAGFFLHSVITENPAEADRAKPEDSK